jgi:hypothetical protein
VLLQFKQLHNRLKNLLPIFKKKYIYIFLLKKILRLPAVLYSDSRSSSSRKLEELLREVKFKKKIYLFNLI